MQSKSDSGNRIVSDSRAAQSYLMYSEPWWRNAGCNTSSLAVPGGNASNSSSLECPNGSESNDLQSLSNNSGPNKDEDNANKETQATSSSRSVGNNNKEHQDVAHLPSAMPAVHDESLTQNPPLQLVGHSIACASNPYQDPYFGAMMGAYGHQPLGYAPYVGLPHARMPLPPEMAQEPVFVNAKQYQGILRRRQARAKAELEKKLIKARKPYLHESRHQHAMRRPRGTGGRFAKKTEVEASQRSSEEKGTGPGTVHSSQSPSTSGGSEPLPAESAETWNSSASQHEARGGGSQAQSIHHVNGSGGHQNQVNMQTSVYNSRLDERREDRDCSRKQWGSISSNQASQRRVTIQ